MFTGMNSAAFVRSLSLCVETGRTCITYAKCSEDLKERDHSEDLSVDGKIIVEWVLRK